MTAFSRGAAPSPVAALRPGLAEGLVGSPPCLVCREPRLEVFLDLGRTALANRFLSEAELAQPEPVYPLRAAFCHGCGHVQLADRVPPEILFRHYLYVSSASASLEAHLDSLAGAIAARERCAPGAFAVDIGSNDGTLGAALARRGFTVIGVDPAANLAALARRRGVETETAFFGADTARRLRARRGPARLLTATNSLPHIPELDDYFEGVAALLAPDGVFVVEAHYLGDLIAQRAFDTIYHEHVSYWALGPLERVLRRHSLAVTAVERLAVHHGQLRVWIRHAGAAAEAPEVGALRRRERAGGLGRPETCRAFARSVREIRRRLRARLARLRAAGSTVAGYGAPAKGSTLLSYLGLTRDWIPYIADRSLLKQGRYTPGAHIPVVAPDRILAEQPDYVLIFAWNFEQEIREQLADYQARGGRFLLPLEPGPTRPARRRPDPAGGTSDV